MPSSPKVSVIVPVYNMACYLEECLESVLSQSLGDIEVICIDDGSSDSSAEILRRFSQRESRIIFAAQENKGAALARNKGIEMASGEFICFLDADDLYPDEDVLKDLYDTAKAQGVKICGGSIAFYSEDAGGAGAEFHPYDYGYVFAENSLRDYRDYQFDYGYQRFIYERKMMADAEIFFPPYNRYQDPPFFAKAMICAERFYALKRVSYQYRTGHKEVVWDAAKLSAVLRGVRDVLILSKTNGLADLHTLTLKRLEPLYIAIEIELTNEGLTGIVELLFELDAAVDEELIRQSRYPDQNPDIAKVLISGALFRLKREKHEAESRGVKRLLGMVRKGVRHE